MEYWMNLLVVEYHGISGMETWLWGVFFRYLWYFNKHLCLFTKTMYVVTSVLLIQLFNEQSIYVCVLWSVLCTLKFIMLLSKAMYLCRRKKIQQLICPKIALVPLCWQISAQESRRKKKEYLEALEKRWSILAVCFQYCFVYPLSFLSVLQRKKR